MQHLSAAVAAVVRSLVEERGWSGRQLARETGINQASVARKLREESPFDLDDLQAITQALSVDLVDLMNAAARLLG
ncbi:helix-turn-helix domain-containing protein [Blastococcus sp. SYSU D00813]